MKKFLIILVVSFILVSCGKTKVSNENGSVYYEIFVGSFSDSNNDGIGDFNGISNKLDYLQELGVKGLWLMPISESDTYHKYDVIDYYSCDSDYGTIEDFENLVQEASKHNIDIIIDLVLNHTSSKNPWFIEAKKNYLNNTCESVDSKCDWYNFSEESKSGYASLGGSKYYEAVFWSEMPDLNLDNQEVRTEITRIVDFWLDKGVKGFRLDAPMHYYASNATKNNEFLAWFTEYVKSKKEDSFIVGEVWSDQQTVLNHYQSGIDSLFDFASSNTDGKIINAIRKGNGQSLAKYEVDYINKIKDINESTVSSIFLSNHDQGRSAAFFMSDETRKLAASIYLLTSNIPFVYYGEEIGMLGSGKDENKRLAMLWGEGNDCQSPIGADYSLKQETSVSQQLKEDDSLLNHYKKVISLRNQYSILTDGVASFVECENDSLYAVSHKLDEDEIIVIHNLSGETVIEKFNGYKIDNQIALSTKASIKDGLLEIYPYSTVILKKN